MSAGVLSSVQPAAGLRHINLRKDLDRVADLLELAFGATLDASGRQMLREMRMLSRSGPLLWLIAGLDRAVQGLMGGYVWIEPEHGQLIGNVSLYPAGFDRAWIIANVAVHPNYRRRGIALEMMHAALDEAHEKGAQRVLLQVEAGNEGARRLYEQLGFKNLRTFTRWRRRPYIPPPRPLPEMPNIHLRQRGEWKAQYALAETLRPNTRGGIGWMRPTRKSEFRPAFSLFNFDNTYHWVVRDPVDGHLRATMRLDLKLGANYGRADVLVAPEEQGKLETPLLNYVLRYLYDRNKGLLIQHPSDDVVMRALLHNYEFEPMQELVHMEWQC